MSRTDGRTEMAQQYRAQHDSICI